MKRGRSAYPPPRSLLTPVPPTRSWQQRDSDTLFSQTAADCFTLTFVGIEGAPVQLYPAQRGTALLGRSRWRDLYWASVPAAALGRSAAGVRAVGQPASDLLDGRLETAVRGGHAAGPHHRDHEGCRSAHPLSMPRSAAP